MSKLYAFNNESDFNRTTAAVKVVEKIHSTGMQSSTHIKQDATYAKITALIATDSEDNKGKQAKGIEAVFDGASFGFIAVSDSPIIYDDENSKEDDATVFTTSNITSETAMTVNDIVKIAHYPNLSKTSDWLVEETGGAGNTALCTILSKGANENQFNVSVKVGNPNAAATGSLPKGILYFNYATTNGIAIGGDILAVTFPSISGTEGVKFDCFAIETVMNLVAPPDEEEEEGEGEGEPPA